MNIIQAIYENGVFRPKQPVDLPESCEVEVEVRTITPAVAPDHLDAIYAILSHRHETDQSDVAARHDEHQP
jgi:predicted DNA-binding antitoxin AbrB/MazE fold protein